MFLVKLVLKKIEEMYMDRKSLWQQLFITKPTKVQRIDCYHGVNIVIKRDDLNHKWVQGNKLRKLKYNLKRAIDEKYQGIATFGGAWSNHILATATAANCCGLESIGFIRGDELKDNQHKWSETLKNTEKQGMRFVFLNRQDYRLKLNSPMVKSFIQQSQSKLYFIPEGGSNQLALKGVVEVIDELKEQIEEPSHLISACGTGGTLSGLIDGISKQGWKTQVLGIPVLKNGEFLSKDIEELSNCHQKVEWDLCCDYHAGGYAKMNGKTLSFAKEFTLNNQIELDKIYTAKSFYAAYDLINKDKIAAGSNVVILHTGGLQGGTV